MRVHADAAEQKRHRERALSVGQGDQFVARHRDANIASLDAGRHLAKLADASGRVIRAIGDVEVGDEADDRALLLGQ